ncbi:MAG: AMP-binding protein, partial [Lysobacteraceae bacterium]
MRDRTGAGDKMDKPIWEPSKERIDHANLSRFMRFAREHHPHADFHDYRAVYDFSIRSPEKFWQLVWDFCGIKAIGDHERVLVEADTMQNARWFPDVRLNFAQNLLRFSDDRTALLFRSENGNALEFSYAQLHEHVGALTAALKEHGVGIGDSVAGFLPNLPAAVIAMLATASLGAVWSSYSPHLAIDDVLDRLGRIKPKLLFCADGHACGGKQFDSRENVRTILDRIDSIACVVMVPYLDPAPSIDGLRDVVLLPEFVAAHAGV